MAQSDEEISSDSDIEESDEEEDFSQNKAVTENKGGEGGIKILTDEELFTITKATEETNAGPTRAPSRAVGAGRASMARNRENTRTTFICFNEDAFRDQLKKEEAKNQAIKQQEASIATQATRAGPVRSAAARNDTRTTFICLNEQAFLQQMLKEQEIQNKLEQQGGNDQKQINQQQRKQEGAGIPQGDGQQQGNAPPRPPRPNRAQTPNRGAGGGQGVPGGANNEGGTRQGAGPRFGTAPPPMRKESKPLSQTVNAEPTKKKMPQVYHELVNTEKDYIRDLEIVVNLFLQKIRKNKLLNHYEIVSLFSNIEELIPVNKKLLGDLLNLDTCRGVGELFQQHAAKFSAYALYCSNQPNIHELLIQYKHDYPEFNDFLKQNLKKPECRKQDLESFLIMPLQRLCKYPLLLKELVSYEHRSMAQTEGEAENGICIWGDGSKQAKKVEIDQYWSGVSCGGLHYAAVSLGNSVYVWGKGREGQLGLGKEVLFRDEPTLVPLYSPTSHPIKVQSVSCGPLQTAIITDKGELYMWGLLSKGPTYLPEQQLFNEEKNQVKCVAFGPSWTLALLSNPSSSTNEVWAWGEATKGQLGLGTGVNRSIHPSIIEPLSDKAIIQISAGETHCGALSEKGDIFLWGDNEDNILHIDANQKYLPNPSQFKSIPPGKHVIQVECGFRHTFALIKGGNEVYSWGYDKHGVLGIGDPSSIDSNQENTKLPQILQPSLSTTSLNTLKTLNAMASNTATTPQPSSNQGSPSKMKPAASSTSSNTRSAMKGSAIAGVSPASGGGNKQWGVHLVKGLGGKAIKAIISGGMHAFALTGNGKLYSWGEGRGFKTCHDKEDDVFEPTLIKQLAAYKIQQVAAGSTGSIAYFENFSETLVSIFNLDAGLDNFRSVVVDINNQVRQVENITKLLKTAEKIDLGDQLNLVSQTRWVVREGEVKVSGRKRFSFLFNDILLLCKIPSSKGNEGSLYKPYRRLVLEDCKLHDIHDSDDGKFRFELQNNTRGYLFAFRKREQKMNWIRSFNELSISKSDTRLVSSSAKKLTKTKSSSTLNSSSVSKSAIFELESKAIELLIQRYEKELQEETRAKLIAEQRNVEMKGLLKEQKKDNADNLLDDGAIKDFENRVESLSSLVDKLTEENVTLSNQLDAKKQILIPLLDKAGLSLSSISLE